MSTVKMFLSLMGGGSVMVSSQGGNFLLIPLSASIVVVTRKKISSRKAISAIEPALISGIARLFLAIVFTFYLKRRATPE
jgi:hypothetical protein